jgi:hypothetical protein
MCKSIDFFKIRNRWPKSCSNEIKRLPGTKGENTSLLSERFTADHWKCSATSLELHEINQGKSIYITKSLLHST